MKTKFRSHGFITGGFMHYTLRLLGVAGIAVFQNGILV
jgi:hypothetical protein